MKQSPTSVNSDVSHPILKEKYFSFRDPIGFTSPRKSWLSNIILGENQIPIDMRKNVCYSVLYNVYLEKTFISSTGVETP